MTATVQEAPKAGAKTQWKLDPTHTAVEFSAKHLMISTVKGRIADVEGTIDIDESNPKNRYANRSARPASALSGFSPCGEVS